MEVRAHSWHSFTDRANSGLRNALPARLRTGPLLNMLANKLGRMVFAFTGSERFCPDWSYSSVPSK